MYCSISLHHISLAHKVSTILIMQPEGKNLIQACLNAPHGQLPSSMPVGTPIGRSANPMNMGGGPPNVPGGLSISGGSKEEGDDGEEGGAVELEGTEQRLDRADAHLGPAVRAQPEHLQ